LAPTFTDFDLWILNARDASDPHNRPRCFLVSVHKTFEKEVGKPTPPVPHVPVSLESVLIRFTGKEAKDRGLLLNQNMKTNITKVKAKIDKKKIRGIICTNADRDPDLTYKTNFFVDCSNAFTCQTRYLTVFKGYRTSSRKLPLKQPRKLDITEKALICGVKLNTLSLLKTDTTRALGNMVPVNLAGCVLRQIMERFSRWEQNHIDMEIVWLLASRRLSLSSTRRAKQASAEHDLIEVN
jgi:site-specific DNA-cytosine methylase